MYNASGVQGGVVTRAFFFIYYYSLLLLFLVFIFILMIFFLLHFVSVVSVNVQVNIVKLGISGSSFLFSLTAELDIWAC